MNQINLITKLFVIVLLSLSQFTNAQKFEKSDDPFTAINGVTYHLGDTLVVCSPADYSDTYKYYYIGKNLTPQKRGAYRSDVINKGQDFGGNYEAHIIKQFRVYDDNRTLAITNKMFNFGIDINNALQTGEIACPEYYEYWEDTTRFFTPKNAFIASKKLSGEINNNVIKEYAFRYDRKAYKQNYSDEFSFHSYVSTKKKELIDEIECFEIGRTYIQPVTLEFGSYDFDTESFPMNWDGESVRFLKDQTETLIAEDINGQGIDLTDLCIYFENTDAFQKIKLNPNKAKLLIDYRKSSSGRVDRTISAGIWFKIKHLADEQYCAKKGIKDLSKQYLVCEIQRIDFFEDKTCKYRYLSTSK
ncbi:DUF4852 domain-containing protein [Plebeiibacterium sediminum]|uniref:DUF4852 domain-containing protein n=1 Tax=Plebeiibacterium sediminum TaxID=2992112 RepID=A0AAE3M9V7_9BACT|nr:DUF4852 domain-containing protein [Plebeiobacterium sediminum]MCW3789612.1 DUF4852 domain-containing protein [Plebeiobacterium sediminum]